MIRNIPINPKLSLKGCWAMVNRVDNFEKLNIMVNKLQHLYLWHIQDEKKK